MIGSRYVPGGATVDWPLHRRLLSRWGNRYTSLVLGLQVRDCTSGYRAYRAGALRAIEPATTDAEGYAFLTELVRRLVRAGYRVMETPIVFTDRRLRRVEDVGPDRRRVDAARHPLGRSATSSPGGSGASRAAA